MEGCLSNKKLQNDVTSCGVFCIHFTEKLIRAYLKGEQSSENYNEKVFIAIEHERIANNILTLSDSLESVCPKCLKNYTIDDSKCYMCERFIHNKCIDISPGSIQYNSDFVLCFLCTHFLSSKKTFKQSK